MKGKENIYYWGSSSYTVHKITNTVADTHRTHNKTEYTYYRIPWWYRWRALVGFPGIWHGWICQICERWLDLVRRLFWNYSTHYFYSVKITHLVIFCSWNPFLKGQRRHIRKRFRWSRSYRNRYIFGRLCNQCRESELILIGFWNWPIRIRIRILVRLFC